MSVARGVTVDQQRAQDAWRCAQGCTPAYVNLAKGLPALIMNSGLLQVLAFLQEKGSSKSQVHCKALGDDLRTWLAGHLQLPVDFEPFMERLMAADARHYQRATVEAFAWLRWLRQLAPALKQQER